VEETKRNRQAKKVDKEKDVAPDEKLV